MGHGEHWQGVVDSSHCVDGVVQRYNSIYSSTGMTTNTVSKSQNQLDNELTETCIRRLRLS